MLTLFLKYVKIKIVQRELEKEKHKQMKKLMIYLLKKNKKYDYFTISEGNKIVAYHFYKVR